MWVLARGDRRVHELCDLVREPQNVVSYHLGKLRDAHLVSGRRSSADRRDTYYSLDLTCVRDALTAAGADLHPALGAGPTPASWARRQRVLFLCTGNSARSPVAEALTVARSGGAIEARSAGSAPKPVHPQVVRVMRERDGIDLAGRRSTHLDEVARDRFDRVITLCDRVRQVCPELPGRPLTAHWSIPDPAAGSGGDDLAPALRRMADDLDTRIGFLLVELAAGGAATTT